MEWPLLKASQEGDTNQLQTLLEEDPLLLQKFALSHYPDSPLHIAALAGRAHFVKDILHQMPSFAWDRNKDGLTPLHIASAMGHTGIVREILKASGPNLCLLKEKGGLTALHYAAMKGRVDVIEEILSNCEDVIREVTAKGETAFHLAVVYSQFEALGVLLEMLDYEDQEILYAVDSRGHTIFHLADRMNQLEVVNLLRNEGLIEAEQISDEPQQDERKHKGMSLAIHVSEVEDGTNNITSDSLTPPPRLLLDHKKTSDHDHDRDHEKLEPSSKNKEVSKRKKGVIAKEVVPVLASLVAAMTYNAVLSPPQTVWKENMKLDFSCLLEKLSKKPSLSMGESSHDCPSGSFYGFMGFNTAGFICAVYLILTRACNIPGAIQFLFPTSMIMLVISYLFLLFSMTPDFGSFLIICSLAFALILYTFYPFALSRFLAWIKEHNKETVKM